VYVRCLAVLTRGLSVGIQSRKSPWRNRTLKGSSKSIFTALRRRFYIFLHRFLSIVVWWKPGFKNREFQPQREACRSSGIYFDYPFSAIFSCIPNPLLASKSSRVECLRGRQTRTNKDNWIRFHACRRA
jgi:hypothetical protein